VAAKILNGIKLAGQERQTLKGQLKEFRGKYNRVSKLVSIKIGEEDYASKIYANMQQKEARILGIDFELLKLPSGIKIESVIKKIDEFNKNELIDGIFVHQPLPNQISNTVIRNRILPSKDVECEHPYNLGKLFTMSGEKKYYDSDVIPPTPASVLYLLQNTKLDIYGKEVVIVGHSNIIGKPLALLLLNKFATVTVTHIATFQADRLQFHIERADIVISAVGKADLIKGSWIKQGAVVIDVGISRTSEGIKGDVEYKEALKKAEFITPVPGGVGPLTVVFLMKNLITLYKKNSKS